MLLIISTWKSEVRISRQSYSVCYAAAFPFTYKLATANYINDRGVKIDTELVQQAIACDLMLSDAMSKKAYELTGLENPNSVSQLKSWLDERGIPMDTLGKKDVFVFLGVRPIFVFCRGKIGSLLRLLRAPLNIPCPLRSRTGC